MPDPPVEPHRPFLAFEPTLGELASTRQGRISVGGFNYQSAYAVARLASMITERGCIVHDWPTKLRYDWGEDLDEWSGDRCLVFTQCKRIDSIGQPAKISSVLLGFAPIYLYGHSAANTDLRFRLICTDPRFLVSQRVESDKDAVEKSFLGLLVKSPTDHSDRATWQSKADQFGHKSLFSALWERLECYFLNGEAIKGHPAGLLLPAEREALRLLLEHSKIAAEQQREALLRLRRLIHDDLIDFNPGSDELFVSPANSPRELDIRDVQNALYALQHVSGVLPFDIVDRTFLAHQRRQPKTTFVARPPEWADVVHGQDLAIKFLERDQTAILSRTVQTRLIDPLKRRTDRRFHTLFVVGPPGSGKTTLVRRVAAMLVDAGEVVVADAGINTRGPADDERSEYARHLHLLASGGRPVLFVLDDPLYASSEWTELLISLNRPGVYMAVLAASSAFLYHRYKPQNIGDVQSYEMMAPTANEGAEFAALYGRNRETLKLLRTSLSWR